MRSRFWICFPFCVVMLFAALPSSADQCLDCHSDPEFKIRHPALHQYYLDFRDSVHGIAGLSCVDCHGGDAETTDVSLAHVDALASVQYEQIPSTCGSCHDNELDAFATSKHYGMVVTQGLAPTCVSCHGGMDVDVLFVTRMKDSCRLCHNIESGLRPDIPDQSDFILTKMNTIKGFRGYTLAHSKDKDALQALESRYSALSEKWHRFSLDDIQAEVSSLLVDYRRLMMQAKKERRH